MALFRREPSEPAAAAAPVDPVAVVDRSAVPSRLLRSVDAALGSAMRFRSLAAGRAEGPVRDRLVLTSSRVDAGALAVYATARQAAQLDAVASSLDPEAAIAAYKEARRRDASPELIEVHRARFESVQRILNSRDELDGRLELLVARLDATVARAAEVALMSTPDLGAVDTDLADVTDELTALRAGLDAVT